MKDGKSVFKTLAQFGSNGSLIIVIILFLGFSLYDNIEQAKVNEELIKSNQNTEKLLEEIEKVEDFKECISDVYDEFNIEFMEMQRILGEVLNEYEVPFPQSLNAEIAAVTITKDKFLKCVVDPTKVK